MNGMELFKYEEQEIRVVMQNDDPWFVANDICKALEISNPSMVYSRLSKDDLSDTEVIDRLGRAQLMKTVNEPGLYDLIFESRKPEAQTFKHWITHEVLPSIRKTGNYSIHQEQPAPAQLEFDFNFDLHIRSAGDLAHARVVISAAEDIVKAKAKLQRLLTNKSEVTVREIKPAINAPKTDLFDAKAYLLKYIEKLKDNPKDPPTVRNLERYATRLNGESIRYYLQWFIEQGIVFEDADHKSPYYYVI